MMFDPAALAAPFAPDQVHWRAQMVYERGGKFSALALAYIDARDVMDRLDAVCGPAGWSNDCIETAKGRVFGKISILVDGQWITKTDGAGDTDVEGEKGGISDALKRAAVLWGVGRYLYRLGNTWAECEVVMDNGQPKKNRNNGLIFKAWTPNGKRELEKALTNLGGYHEPVISDADADRAEILTLAGLAGVTLIDIAKAAKVGRFDDIPASALPAIKRKLNLTIDQKAAA